MTIKYNIIKIKKIFQKVRELSKHSLSGDVVFVRDTYYKFHGFASIAKYEARIRVCVYIYDILATFFYIKKNISLNIYFVFCKKFCY